MTKTWVSSVIVLGVLSACMGEDDLGGRGGRMNVDNSPKTTMEAPDPTQPGGCKEGVAHVGLGGTNFVADRVQAGIGADQRRVKPYSALKTEFARALGQVPQALTTNAATFGQDPPRWYREPVAGAVSLYTVYSIAFSGCYDTLTDAKYTNMPTLESATAECAAMQNNFWQRTPTADETAACATLATTGVADEPVARRRWAHACASILTSAEFLSY